MPLAPTLRIFALTTFALLAGLAQALDIKPYSATELAALQTAGKPVALHFHADWCPTCRAQSKAFAALKSDPQIDMTLLVAAYDDERSLKQTLGVRSQSTLIVYKGSTETARLIGDTAPDKLRAALSSAR